MSNLDQLQHLSCVSKVCTELNNHLGLSDRDLAEFVIHLGKNSETVDQFLASLKQYEADFPQDFSTNLYNIICKMLPSAKNNTSKSSNKDTSTGSSSSSGGSGSNTVQK